MNMQNAKIIESDKIIVVLLLCTAFSLFLFCEPARTMLSQSKINMSYNLLFIIFGTMTVAYLLLKEFVDIRIVLVTFAFTGVASISIIATGNTFSGQWLKVMAAMIIPFLMTGFRLPESVFETFMRRFIKSVNVVCLILVVIGIFDYLSGAAIQTYFATHHIFDNEFAHLVLLERSYGIYRYYSFLGHPLTNAWYLLMFYVLNILHDRYFKEMLNEYILTLITLIGLVLCGSRTALVIGLLMFVFLNNRRHKVPYVLLLSTLSAGIALTPMFQNNLMKRFVIGMHSGDFSEGRNEASSRVFNNIVKQPSFFTGGGVSYSREVTLSMGGFIKSFEYPFMMFVYDWGIIGTILIYILILLIPALIFLKNKNYFLLIFLFAISLYMNGSNDISNYSDVMGQLCFFIMIMVNMSYLIKIKRKKCEEV